MGLFLSGCYMQEDPGVTQQNSFPDHMLLCSQEGVAYIGTKRDPVTWDSVNYELAVLPDKQKRLCSSLSLTGTNQEILPGKK
jgi:hypothetical protein